MNLPHCSIKFSVSAFLSSVPLEPDGGSDGMRRMMGAMARIKLKYLSLPTLAALFLILDYLGAFTHVLELDYHTVFSYPLDGDVTKWAEQMKKGASPDQKPVNTHDYTILKTAKRKCVDNDGDGHYIKLRLVYIVKSAMKHFDRRAVIRRTWGYEKRFSDVPVRTVFLLGSGDDSALQSRVEEEARKHVDIVQGDFLDTYYNNTLKTMMGLRWAAEQCPTARFYFFADDDYYVSTRNVLRFLRNPVNYPGYLEDPVVSFDEDDDPTVNAAAAGGKRKLQQLVDFDLPDDVVLFAGHVFQTAPHRHKPGKFYVSLAEYPYHLWPPYVTAGSYVLSRSALIDFYYASYFVKKFRFDDVYLGIVSLKLAVEPFHSDEFHFHRKPDVAIIQYRYVVASHGFSNPTELEKFWNMQKQAGNA
jgi:hypothetical protein